MAWVFIDMGVQSHGPALNVDRCSVLGARQRSDSVVRAKVTLSARELCASGSMTHSRDQIGLEDKARRKGPVMRRRIIRHT